MSDSLHVRPQVNPIYIREIIRNLNNFKDLNDLKALLQERGYNSNLFSEQITWLRKMGLLKKRGVDLTNTGNLYKQILYMQSSIFFDMLHFLQFTKWDIKNPDINRFSWTYQMVCRNIWNMPLVEFDRKKLINVLINEASQAFPGESTVSLSLKTIDGVIIWLKFLEPSVFGGNIFLRRHYAPLELAIMATHYFYRLTNYEYGDTMTLNEELTKEISILCLIDESAVMELLEEGAQRFSSIDVEPKWGYHIRFYSFPDLLEGL